MCTKVREPQALQGRNLVHHHSGSSEHHLSCRESQIQHWLHCKKWWKWPGTTGSHTTSNVWHARLSNAPRGKLQADCGAPLAGHRAALTAPNHRCIPRDRCSGIHPKLNERGKPPPLRGALWYCWDACEAPIVSLTRRACPKEAMSVGSRVQATLVPPQGAAWLREGMGKKWYSRIHYIFQYIRAWELTNISIWLIFSHKCLLFIL